MSEDEITQWLVKRGRKKDLSIELAKKLPRSRASHGSSFPSVDEAKAFLRDELKILAPHVLND